MFRILSILIVWCLCLFDIYILFLLLLLLLLSSFQSRTEVQQSSDCRWISQADRFFYVNDGKLIGKKSISRPLNSLSETDFIDTTHSDCALSTCDINKQLKNKIKYIDRSN